MEKLLVIVMKLSFGQKWL